MHCAVYKVKSGMCSVSYAVCSLECANHLNLSSGGIPNTARMHRPIAGETGKTEASGGGKYSYPVNFSWTSWIFREMSVP